jgi:ABC-type taurine transport system substrate-binding protein
LRQALAIDYYSLDIDAHIGKAIATAKVKAIVIGNSGLCMSIATSVAKAVYWQKRFIGKSGLLAKAVYWQKRIIGSGLWGNAKNLA